MVWCEIASKFNTLEAPRYLINQNLEKYRFEPKFGEKNRVLESQN